ncbi:oligoribonuclease [Halobacillus litoralis]|uniref:Oligoribonuclease n=1 Tax=Halobacillus litoralis TaxID=45668 RepID=A0A410MCH5_9BACI|nr:oligoribonuclease [Halobacillus litoralis]QAS52378.1 oligoribonuclease [Halobacillus litoralis]
MSQRDSKDHVNKKEAAKKEPTYNKSELVTNANAAFNVSPEVVVGALNSFEKEIFTVDEVKSAINKFMKRKV